MHSFFNENSDVFSRMNGFKNVRFAFRHINSPVAYCALSVRTGTRDENPAYNGLAHLTEHMLFKGTERRGAASINNVLERVGGELNAYTTKEEIVLHATVLREDLSKAVDLLAELAFTSVFPDRELEKELDVVYDEIVSYEDSPADAIYDHFEELLFEGHPLSLPILGRKKTLKKISSRTLREYLFSSFVPEKMAFTVAAAMEEKKAAGMVEKSLKKYYKGKEDIGLEIYREDDGQIPEAARKTDSLRSLAVGKKFDLEVHRKNHQVHCILGCSAYSLYDPERVPLAVLCNILGGPASGSRLNMVLREKNALVYNVEAGYTSYSDTGIFTVYFGCDKSDLPKCLELVRREIDKMVNVSLSDRALGNAKKQLLGQLSIARDNAEAQCLSMGKSLMVYNRIDTFEKMRGQIEAVTATGLQETASRVLQWDRLSKLVYK